MQGIDNLPKSGGSSTLSGLADVNFSSLTQGDLLIYDGAEWINHSFTEGHTILNESGTAVTARDNLQFTDGLKVTDDSGNNKTKVGVNTTFTEASTRTNIASGDSFSTILGKIKKWFTDIPSLFVSKTGDTMTGALTVNESSAIQATFSRSHSDTTSKLSLVALGNNIAEGTAGSAYGALRFYGKSSKYVDLVGLPTSNHSINFPDEGGTIALTSDLSDYVAKSGDTMSGNLTIGTTVRGELFLKGNDPTYKGRIYNNGANALTADRNYYLPDASGTLALVPTQTTLFNNVSITTADQWISIMNPSINVNDYDYLGFSWAPSGNSYDQKKIQVLVKVSDFKVTTTTYPINVIDDPWVTGNSRQVRTTWDGADGLSVYRGNSVNSNHVLTVVGINF